MNKLKALRFNVQMATMTAFFALWSLVLAVVDIFAFENGATATISQCWLSINRGCWFATYFVVFWMGVLIQHVAISRQPGTPQDTNFSVPQSILWALTFIGGMYVGYRWLYQLPQVD
jgi:hypothetical protein